MPAGKIKRDFYAEDTDRSGFIERNEFHDVQKKFKEAIPAAAARGEIKLEYPALKFKGKGRNLTYPGRPMSADDYYNNTFAQITLNSFRDANFAARERHVFWQRPGKKGACKNQEEYNEVMKVVDMIDDSFAVIGGHIFSVNEGYLTEDAIQTIFEKPLNQGKIPLAFKGGRIKVDFCELCRPL